MDLAAQHPQQLLLHLEASRWLVELQVQRLPHSQGALHLVKPLPPLGHHWVGVWLNPQDFQAQWLALQILKQVDLA